jgi:hypothetical protein
MKHIKKTYLIFFILALPVIVILSCSKDGGGGGSTNCAGITTSFSANVSPLINTFCNQPSCHNSGSTNGPGPLTNYAQVFAARSSIRSQVQSGLMPQNTTLTAEQKNIIICWIDSGAPNN